eukprot:227085-Rhodomonas_salina.1
MAGAATTEIRCRKVERRPRNPTLRQAVTEVLWMICVLSSDRDAIECDTQTHLGLVLEVLRVLLVVLELLDALPLCLSSPTHARSLCQHTLHRARCSTQPRNPNHGPITHTNTHSDAHEPA